MCGISGFLDHNIDRKERERVVQKINQYQARRGPDDEGIVSVGLVTLGHRRLSIIDLSSAGHQPMSYDNGRFWITFNGEIYNFQEFKDELRTKGYFFTTNTDTEVILALFKEYQEKCFRKMRGIFAFALWDTKEEVLYLVRDHYGVKPLYYYAQKESLLFTSSVKALKASGCIPEKKNRDAFIGFLLLGSVPEPHTTLCDVFSVPAGSYLKKERNKKEEIIRYYDPLDSFLHKNNDTFDVAVQNVQQKLSDAVRCNLVSDAPLGIFLSGGLDSSTLSVLAAQTRKNPIATLSVYFEEEEFSERKYQHIVAQKIKSDHKEILVRKKDFEEELGNIFVAMDQPTIDGVNTYIISKVAHDAGLKVVLSGLGSDEIFCGYTNFRRVKLLRKFQKFPTIFRLPLFLTPLLGKRYSRLSRLKSNRIIDFYLTVRGIMMPQEIAHIMSIPISDVENYVEVLEKNNFEKNYEKLQNLHPVDLLSYLELTMYMKNQLLRDADMMSMTHSLEARVPFLDFPLVEYVSSLSPIIKTNRRLKRLLVEAIGEDLPHEIWDRKKMGFTFPLQKWLTGRLLITDYKLPVTKFHWSQNWAMEVLKRFSLF